MACARATCAQIIVAAAVSLVAPGTAQAWGRVGHEVVAAIAEERLRPEARALVQELLGEGRLSDPEIALWADQHRDETTRPWHYVNIPFGASGYDPERDCRRGACAVAVIERAAARLAAGGDRRERLDALRWLVHLVGDLHQPLHAGDGWDHGGSRLRARLGNRREPTNLHHVWDTEVVQALAGGREPPALARALAAAVDAKEAGSWAADLRPAAWAEASSQEARAVYGELGITPREQGIVALPKDYPGAQRRRVALALSQAGVRLAALLDRVAGSR